MTQGFAVNVLGSGEDTTSHSNQLLWTVKGLQRINKPEPFSPTHARVQTPSTDTDPQQPPWQSSLGRGYHLLCTCRGRGSPPAHIGLWGQSPLPAIAPEKTCSWYQILKEHHCLVVVGSSHIAGTLSLCPQDLQFSCLFLYLLLCKQSVEGKETTHIATQKAKQAHFGKGK